MSHTFARSLHSLERLSSSQQAPLLSPTATPAEIIDRSLALIGESMVTKEDLAEALEKQKQEVDQQFDKVDQQFNKVDQQFDKVDQRFEKVEQRLDTMDRRGEEDRRRGFNSLAVRGWERVHQLGTFDAAGELRTPEYFPDTVMRFWKLKSPRRGEKVHSVHHATILIRSTVNKLIYLVEFYGIEGHQHWETENDDADSINSSECDISISAAVRRNPEYALRALAGRLGLAYDRICRFMERLDEFEGKSIHVTGKREQVTAADLLRRGKKMRKSPQSGESDIPLSEAQGTVPREMFYKEKSTSESKRSEVSDKVRWDHTLPDRGVPDPESQGRQGSSPFEKTQELDPQFYKAMDSPSSQET